MASHPVKGSPPKVHADHKVSHATTKGKKHVKHVKHAAPGKVDEKAREQNQQRLERARQGAVDLTKMGAGTTVARASTGSVAGSNLDALKSKLLGKNVISTSEAALNVLVQLYAESPSKAASELQRMFLPHSTPDKGNV